ncbi:hypothetical protein FACS1894217_03530 [Clostridia bacterium]|nr:hypothetical protein FACS1894217_03530 [Clostridia bacterium]
MQTYSASANIVTTASAASVSLSGKVYKLNTSTDTLSTSTLGNGGTTTASINLGSSAPTRFYKLEVKYTGSKGTGKWTDSTTIVT